MVSSVEPFPLNVFVGWNLECLRGKHGKYKCIFRSFTAFVLVVTTETRFDKTKFTLMLAIAIIAA